MTKKQVRVLVLGGRLTPSLVAVLSNPPDAIEFIVSKDTPDRDKQAQSVLADQLEKILPASDLPPVDPFNWNMCQKICERVAVERHPDAKLIFDVTTAPKFISFAVQDFAARNGHEVVVVDTAKAREVSLIDRAAKPLNFPQDLAGYLRLFGREYKPRFCFKNYSISKAVAIEMARYLACHKAAASALNKFNRWNPGGKGRWNTPKANDDTTTPEEFEVFQVLANKGLITDLKREAGGKTLYRISQNPADTGFIKGTWLEVYVWAEADALRDKNTGERIFSKCQIGFEIPHPAPEKREIDVGCIYQGQLIYCSCKARQPKDAFNKANLDEMTGVSKLIGGDFVTRVFVTNAFAPQNKEQWQFIKAAEKQRAVVVTGDDLPEVGEILRRQAIEPDYARI